MKGQKGLRRWEIAQKAEREWWQNWDPLKFGSIKKQLDKYWGSYIERIAKYVSFEPGWKILDIGCGPDGIINHIPVGQRFGLDPLMDFYLSNFELSSDMEWKTGTMEDIPFDSNYFDVVITTNTLDHSLEPEKGLGEIHRVLKKEGSLVLAVHCYAPFRRFLRLVKEKVGMSDKPHPYSFSQRRVKAMMREAGFTLSTNYKGIGSWGMRLCERPLASRFDMVDKVANVIFWLEGKTFGYSCLDFVFIAQKG